MSAETSTDKFHNVRLIMVYIYNYFHSSWYFIVEWDNFGKIEKLHRCRMFKFVH